MNFLWSELSEILHLIKKFYNMYYALFQIQISTLKYKEINHRKGEKENSIVE